MNDTRSPLVPLPVGPTADAWSLTPPFAGVTASASTVPPSWRVKTTAEGGGAGKPFEAFVDDEGWVDAAATMLVLFETGPGVRCSRTATITTPATPTERATMLASSRTITVDAG